MGTGEGTTGTDLPAVVDWVVALAVVLGGLLLLIGGTVLAFVVDRALVADGSIRVMLLTRELTGPAAVDFVLTIVTWTGWGLLLTWAGMVTVGIGYGLRRYRTKRRVDAGEPVASYGANALLGAVVSGLVFSVPFSAIGGAVAGSVERGASERVGSVGAFASLLAMAPVLAILLFVIGGLLVALSSVGSGGLGLVSGLVMVLVVMVVAIIGAGRGDAWRVRGEPPGRSRRLRPPSPRVSSETGCWGV